MKSVHGEANRKRIADWLPKPSQDDIDSGIEPHVDAVVEAVHRRRARTSVDQPAVAAAGRVGRGE